MSFPILYKAKETDFNHLGLGVLRDATECLVTEERNGIFELKMQYPIDGAGFEEIKNDRLIKADASNDLKGQRFKIIRITKPAKGLVTIYAEHISYLTQDLPLEPEVSYVGGVQGALNLWKNSTVVENPFTVYTDIATEGSINWTIDKVANSRRALGGVSGSMLDVFGGEYLFDNYDISLLKNRGEDKGALIAYGKNLTDLEQDEQITNTYTSIYPYSRYVDDNSVEHIVTLPERYIDSDQVDNYARRKVLTVDFTTDEITTESALRTRAERYITDNSVGMPRVSLKVKFVDLAKTLDYKHLKLIEEINLCDIVTVYFEKLGIRQKAKVIKTVWNVLLDRYEELEIGESRATLTSAISTEIREQEESTIVVFDNLRKQIINSYWNSDGYNYDLRAGNEYSLPGGYYSFDKPIDQNPTKAIYMGAGTLLIANSKNVNGSWNWRTVATGDGLVADVIATGMLKSINGQSYFDLTNNKIKTSNAEITGGDINISTSGASYSKIRTHYNEWAHEMQPLGTYLNNSKTGDDSVLQAGGLYFNSGPSRNSTYQLDGIALQRGTENANFLFNASANPPKYGLTTGNLQVENFAGVKDLNVTGTKNRVVDTPNYGRVLLNAYETPRPTFADTGHAQIGEDGLCYIDIDSVFLETIDHTHDYRHFLTKYGQGDLWIKESNVDYFVVEGTPNLEFDWKVEAIQRDYNAYNLEKFEGMGHGIAEEDYINLASNYLKEYERELIA